ncbi:hypothetical protein KUCAC02_030735 [Chaenocephalus aceratus]|uniref:Uncharacterized protein n=1 Tax=Chaenocephalus aceratus TaxID=36190 RepID=A0ACB9XKE5_CHAAC|nr:hypothetical protein KUCAC02_030735 [Chaenocephalus aceratus]
MLKVSLSLDKPPTPNGDQIRLLPDFTQAVSKQRAAFNKVRRLLRSCEGVRYGLKYPANIGGPRGKFQQFKTGKGVRS